MTKEDFNYINDVALVSNITMGGKVYSKLHFDTILKNPNIYVENKLIMKRGKLLPKYL